MHHISMQIHVQIFLFHENLNKTFLGNFKNQLFKFQQTVKKQTIIQPVQQQLYTLQSHHLFCFKNFQLKIVSQVIIKRNQHYIHMPRIFIQYLEGNNIYICRKCGAHFTKLSSLISESFSGGSGTAFLFNEVINVKEGKPQQKKMITGLHLVCDIFCVGCNSDKPIGWKYIKAHNPSQVYKEGKFILEVAYLRKQSWIEFDD